MTTSSSATASKSSKQERDQVRSSRRLVLLARVLITVTLWQLFTMERIMTSMTRMEAAVTDRTLPAVVETTTTTTTTTTTVEEEDESSVADSDSSAITSSTSNNNDNANANIHHDFRQPCRYDGQCPVGTTCGVRATTTTTQSANTNDSQMDPTTTEPGTCQAFPLVDADSDTSDSRNKLDACVQACRTELELDEHFFHESSPNIKRQAATSATGRPAGCALDFVRTHDKDWSTLHSRDGSGPRWQPEPSIQTWDQTRFRHILRVDAMDDEQDASNNSKDAIVWRAYCSAPCQSNNDCRVDDFSTSDNPPWQCVQGACQRNAPFWEPLSSSYRNAQTRDQMVIVTGATASYFGGLTNLVASAQYWAPTTKVVVYNLGGLNENEAKEIRSWPNVLSYEWENGMPEHYPPHVHVGKIYAWKPLIMNETVHKYGSIFWLDAGNTLTGPIAPVEDIVKRNGIFLVRGQDTDMRPKAHPNMYKWFGMDKETTPVGPHYSGNTQAYMYPSRFVESIVELNAKCAWDKNCISPEGSGLGNHRYDQTSLSLCAYHARVQAHHHTEYLSASKTSVNSNLLEPSYRMVWTARQSCRFYTVLRKQQGDVNYFNYSSSTEAAAVAA